MEQPALFDLEQYIDETQSPAVSVFSEFLGEEVAEVLVQAMGGLDLVVPVDTSCDEYKELVAKIGEAPAQKLSNVFGGEKIYIPREQHVQITKRNKDIWQRVQELYSQGTSITRAQAQAAREFGLTQRHIRRIC